MAKNGLPQVDIICACRNSPRYLPEMIESVLNQDYPRVELFVQDGASTDGTIDILRRYPIRWASVADNGISQALNRAIEATQGEVIGITNTDDLLQPGAVSAAAEIFKTNPQVVMVYGDCYQIDLEGRPFKVWKSMPFDLDWLFWECYIPGQTVYIRREAIRGTGGFDETLKLVQDLDLWLRLGSQYPAASIEYIPRIQGSYRVVPNSAGLGNPRDSASCILRVMSKFLDDSAKVACLKKGKSRAFAGISLQLVVSYLMAGERWLACKTYLQAVRSYPPLLLMNKGMLTLPQLIAGDGLRRAYRRIEQKFWVWHVGKLVGSQSKMFPG